ncbi:PKD domain-containing protein [Nocardia sp. N13]|uniref:PKD domain-containing protein n=1 Tax=Nocardioides sp. N13(2025) TaxID=3453405 RepID=UPI003F762017
MTRHAKALLVRLITTVLAVAGLALVTITTTPAAQAAPGDVGYADFKYGPGLTGDFIDPDNSPTASKPQSKLWFAQGKWWGVLQQPNTTRLSIWSFSPGTQSWTDTGVLVDDRTGAKQADVLWDGTKLYIASAGREGGVGIRVSRFKYDGSKYVLDGLQTTVNGGGVEAAVIAKDTTKRLWVAYTAAAGTDQRNVRVVVSNPEQTSFGEVFSPPVGGTLVDKDDIATIIAQNGSVTVVWSNQIPDPVTGETAIYAASHADTAASPLTGWDKASTKILDGPSVADDHIAMSGVDGAGGSIFVVVKESSDDPAHVDTSEGLVRLLVLKNGTWTNVIHSRVRDNMTRPIILLEPSNDKLHVFATSPLAGGVIYEKTTSMSNPVFAEGKGDPYIKLADHTFINNATSTKQNITDTSGVLVLASDQKTGYYVHNYTPGSASPAPVKPVADFTYTPQTGPAPLAVQFTSTSKDAKSVSWNFGDGTAASTLTNPSHTFTEDGKYTVTLTATNYAGSTTKSVDITVKLPVPVASFTNSPTTGPAPLAVKFTDTSTGPPTAWTWDFGDGTPTSKEQNPTHTFAKAGTYTVKLTATNESGSSTKTATVTVAVSVPKASFTWAPTTGTAPLAVKFTDTSTGPPSSWAWTFGDGGTSTQQSPSYTYAKPGTYTVSLKVTNASGTSTKTDTVVVAAVPVPTVVLDKPSAAVTLGSYVDVAWHATTTPTLVKGYDVEVSSIGTGKGSTWATTVLANQTGTALQVPGMAGYAYCMRVRGTNTAGVAGAWSEARCTALPLDDRSLSRKGDWRRASGTGYYMGTASITRQRGASLSKTVTGKQVYLLVGKRSGGGKVQVFVGKRLVKKVSLAARKARTSELITIASYATDTTKRYRIVVKSDGKPVVIDGLAVTR